MKAKCIKCGDTVEVTRPKEYKTCKCGAIALDYGDPPYYYRVGGNPEDFDGEIEDAPKIRERERHKRTLYRFKSRLVDICDKSNGKYGLTVDGYLMIKGADGKYKTLFSQEDISKLNDPMLLHSEQLIAEVEND